MKQVKQIQLKNLIAGKQDVALTVSVLAHGVYYVIIHLQTQQLTAKFSVID